MADLIVQFSTAAPTEWFDKHILDRSNMICRVTRSPFSHVDLILDDGNLLGSSNSPNAPTLQGNPGGVAVRPPNYHEFCIRRWAKLPCSDRVRRNFVDYCCSQLSKPFDSDALKPQVIFSQNFKNRDWRNDEKWFCAELMAHATEVSHLIWWPIIGVKNRITPADLLFLWNPIMDVEQFYRAPPHIVMGKYEME